MNKLYFFLCLTFVFIFTASTAWSANYNETIKEGQTAAEQIIKDHKASALTIALVDANHIIWSQTFGVDPSTGKLPTETTMFGIGSVSKTLAAIAVMKLVDRGIINLDTPLTTYLPKFKMASPEYKNITVRMLLNHSAGFPGTDYRNSLIRNRDPEYSNQVLETLAHERLKTPPGYTSVYCNDCFTLIEPLIQEKTGKSYVQFIQDEIFIPLGMKNSRYPTDAFPEGSYVEALQENKIKPQEYVNTLASGGAYTTANDLARVAMMFLNNGTLGETRILSKESIAKMAEDQTASQFKPVRSQSWSYGLGWDSVVQPGLLAVGFDGWSKGGDSIDYGAAFTISPKAGLGVIVIGASGFPSSEATALAERILLRALAENQKIPHFPLPLTANPPSAIQENPKVISPDISGVYASTMFVFNFVNRDHTLMVSTLSDKGWKTFGVPVKLMSNGWYADPKTPLTQFKVVTATLFGKPTEYFVTRAPLGYGHYQDSLTIAQKMHASSHHLSSAWNARLNQIWLIVNAHPDELNWTTMDPRLRLYAIPNLQGLIAIRTPVDPVQFQILNPSTSDTEATMMVTIPQLQGRDLNDLVVVKRDHKEWMQLGSYMHQPLSSVNKLVSGKKQIITIGSDGYAEWRAISYHRKPVKIMINTSGSWKLYDANFKSLGEGKGDGTVTLPAGKGLGYLVVYGKPGEDITVTI